MIFVLNWWMKNGFKFGWNGDLDYKNEKKMDMWWIGFDLFGV